MNGAASSRSPAALLRRGPLAARAQQPAMPGFLNAVHPPEWVALNNINETGNLRWAGSSRGGRRSQAKLWIAVGIAIAVVATAWLAYSYRQSDAAASAPAALPQVVVSKPLEREVDFRLGFLGQFSAVEQVELRAQVGGTLTDIDFKDGQIVHQGDLLFIIDPRPYEIRLAQAKAQLKTAEARLVLAGRELHRAEVQRLKRPERNKPSISAPPTSEPSRPPSTTPRRRSATPSSTSSFAVSRRPSPGRIGAHLVSVGNLITGSRGATSPTTLLATIVSLDPIYLDFDMSESDFLTFSRDRARLDGRARRQVAISLSDETISPAHGTLDFIDNALDRSQRHDPCPRHRAESGPSLDAGPVRPAAALPSAPPAPVLLRAGRRRSCLTSRSTSS